MSPTPEACGPPCPRTLASCCSGWSSCGRRGSGTSPAQYRDDYYEGVFINYKIRWWLLVNASILTGLLVPVPVGDPVILCLGPVHIAAHGRKPGNGELLASEVIMTLHCTVTS